MPKQKRTRKQKERVAVKKEQTVQVTFNFAAAQNNEQIEQKKSIKDDSVQSFFAYNVNLIYKDVLKTVVISIILISVLLVIYFKM